MQKINNKLHISDYSLVHAIGNTPLIKLHKLSPDNTIILAKFEGANPGGSIKDRTAWYMIKKAIESGELTPDKIILEPTSGNTGIGLAMVGSALGYKVILCMPKCVSVERQQTLIAFGAQLVLTEGCLGTDGAIIQARKMYQENPEIYFMPDQFSNPANVLAHYETTGAEILAQTGGQIDAFVAGIGTTGTIMGVTKRLKEYNPSIKIFAVEPVIGHSIQGLKNMKEAIVPSIYNPDILDDIITVDDETAFEYTRKLALQEGLFCGMSSGAAVAGSIEVAKRIKHGRIVTILPDRGDRYLSTALFQSICAKCPP
ncbi:MAG: cysteine synthase family protein [Spirochaetes bacterium]|nr:cysteine synthase family protein [Spirochaetota bacterium]